MIHSSALHSRTRKLLASAAGLIAIALVALGIQTNRQYLRTSALNSQSEDDAAFIAPATTTATYTATGYALEHPSNWSPEEDQGDGRLTTTIGPLAIIQYENSITIPENVIANQLGTGVSNLYSWQGQLGSSAGTYWANRSLTAGTAAPEGKRLYVTNSPAGTILILLPSPPYDLGTAQIITSFTTK